MTGTIVQTDVKAVKSTTSSLQPTDITSMAETILSQALEFCAQKLALDGSQYVVNHLQQDDHTTYRYWRYGLAKRAAECLGALDEDIEAVYIYDYDATPDDVCFAEVASDTLIHLIIRAQRKTAALNAVIEALDHAMVEAHIDLLGTHQLKYLLDAQMVDDHDVEHRLGYGALFSSLHHRPLMLWKR